jgi:hypothetical protein
MKDDLRKTGTAPLFRPLQTLRPLHAVVLAILSMGTLLWAIAILAGGPHLEDEEFLLLASVFGGLSLCFVIHRLRGNLVRIFEIPVFITIIVFIRFGLVPIYCYFDPPINIYTLQGDSHTLLAALLYVTLGMLAFWIGASWLANKKNTSPDLDLSAGPVHRESAPNSVLTWAVGLYATSFAAKVYLLHAQMYSYTASLDVYYQHLASAQILNGVSQLGTYAMILVAIERYFHPSDARWRLIFNSIFVSECAWGLISGMKSLLLWNFVLLVLISSISQRKLRMRWTLAIIPILVLIYPFYNEYRILIRAQGLDVSSLSTARQVAGQALSESIGNQSGTMDWLSSGAESAAARLDLLDSVSTVIAMGPQLADVRTREYWWLLPVYPFFPRVIWPSKPVQNAGLNFNLALGGNDETSAAITYPGDLYLELGFPGIVAGMLGLGLFGQWLTNKTRGTLNKSGLFIYAALFMSVVNLEDDVFGFWSEIIKWFAILCVLSWLVYRPRRSQLRSHADPEIALAR